MTKKVYKQKCFLSVITKNLNWEILTKNKMGLRMKNFNIFGVIWRIRFLREGGRVTKNQYKEGIA